MTEEEELDVFATEQNLSTSRGLVLRCGCVVRIGLYERHGGPQPVWTYRVIARVIKCYVCVGTVVIGTLEHKDIQRLSEIREKLEADLARRLANK